MPRLRIWIVLAALALLAGCATSASKMNGLRLGMDRTEVVSVMGEPDSTSEIDHVLYLRYRLSAGQMFSEEYYVRLTGGAVDAYGRRGDFGLGY